MGSRLTASDVSKHTNQDTCAPAVIMIIIFSIQILVTVAGNENVMLFLHQITYFVVNKTNDNISQY